MPTIVFTYSPVEGVSLEDFGKFLDEVDGPATLQIPSAKSIRKLVVVDEGAPFKVIELLEVTSLEEWKMDTAEPTPEIKKVLDLWPQYGKVDEMKIYNCMEF
jgi:CRISPR/Cas system CMR-associated protein Cmr3 (group 5 of RAMP superfamily)